ncbi:MAG TPA: hypothetical protein V6C58_14050 [Allocoleopsis sp.]
MTYHVNKTLLSLLTIFFGVKILTHENVDMFIRSLVLAGGVSAGFYLPNVVSSFLKKTKKNTSTVVLSKPNVNHYFDDIISQFPENWEMKITVYSDLDLIPNVFFAIKKYGEIYVFGKITDESNTVKLLVDNNRLHLVSDCEEVYTVVFDHI